MSAPSAEQRARLRGLVAYYAEHGMDWLTAVQRDDVSALLDGYDALERRLAATERVAVWLQGPMGAIEQVHEWVDAELAKEAGVGA